MSNDHLLRKAILICQTSAFADVLTDGELMSAIAHVYAELSGGGEQGKGSSYKENGPQQKTEEAKRILS